MDKAFTSYVFMSLSVQALMQLLDRVRLGYDTSDQDIADMTKGEL